MKRDLDLIKRILEKIESSEQRNIKFSSQSIASYFQCEDSELFLHNVQLLLDYHLILSASHCYETFILGELTWQGHDFLDNMKNDTVWNSVQKVSGSISFSAFQEIVKDLAKTTALNAIKATPGFLHMLGLG